MTEVVEDALTSFPGAKASLDRKHEGRATESKSHRASSSGVGTLVDLTALYTLASGPESVYERRMEALRADSTRGNSDTMRRRAALSFAIAKGFKSGKLDGRLSHYGTVSVSPEGRFKTRGEGNELVEISGIDAAKVETPDYVGSA